MEDDQKTKSASKLEEQKYLLHRHLQAITDVIRIVTHATDEVPMLEEVCRIIVEIGGYRLAWVGYAGENNGKNVRPVAHKGFEDGYLDTVNISWADTERGHGPTGTAIRTGKTVIAQNILDQEGYDPWRNQALQRGFAASIAVPFTFAGTCRGTLNVYAAAPQAFDADEAKLMEELAQDLAFGISTLRGRAESQRIEEALRETEERLRLKLSNILSPDYKVEDEEFRHIINSEAIQSIMDDFYKLTQIGVAILDLKGNILVATGWQDICTRFHRVHPETSAKCTESDLALSQGVPPGEIRGYKCGNNLWDFVTPIFISDKHMGNLYLGQFFFDDEVPDYDLFYQQAERYGFDKGEYRAALDRVPRWSRERVNTSMKFYRQLADMISKLSFSNLKLARELIERQRVEENLLKEQNLRNTLIDNLPCIALILKKGSREIVASNKAARAVGAVPGKTCYQTCANRDDMCPFCLAPELWKTNESRSIEVEYRRTYYLGIWVPLSEDLYVHYIFDITERKQAEADKEKLETQNRQLQKAESLGRMAGAIAHTFNNQLGVVIGNLEMAIDELPKGAGQTNQLTAAMRAAQKAAEVSGQMLTYLGQSFDKHELVDLAETCRRNLPIIEAALPGTVALEINLPSLGPAVMANATEIQQVLTNLITNAWEAAGAGRGSIHLSVKTVSPAGIPTRHRYPIDWQPQDNDYACLAITDADGGIADEDIEKLFDPFFSSKFTGRGMGLPVVLGIVKAHGGAITIESELGRGSTFRVFLPVSAAEVTRQPDKELGGHLVVRCPPNSLGSGTVLLVDDEEMVRNMAAAMLERLGFTVLAAKDGVEAVELFNEHKDEIRFVLSDLTMPRMDGWETMTALRQLAPGIPVILASGYDKAQVMAGDHPELPQVFLGKPYGLQGLKEAIGQALGSGK